MAALEQRLGIFADPRLEQLQERLLFLSTQDPDVDHDKVKASLRVFFEGEHCDSILRERIEARPGGIDKHVNTIYENNGSFVVYPDGSYPDDEKLWQVVGLMAHHNKAYLLPATAESLASQLGEDVSFLLPQTGRRPAAITPEYLKTLNLSERISYISTLAISAREQNQHLAYMLLERALSDDLELRQNMILARTWSRNRACRSLIESCGGTPLTDPAVISNMKKVTSQTDEDVWYLLTGPRIYETIEDMYEQRAALGYEA